MKLISRLRPYSFHVLARQTITTIFLLLSIITVQGCGGTDDLPSSSSSSSSSSSTSSSSSSSSSSGIVEVKDLSQVNGRILDIAGQPIEGASIAVYSGGTEPSKSAVSSSDGSFSLKLEAEKDFVLRVTAASFADQVVPVKSPDTGGEITIEAGLIARATPITISDNSTLTHAGNAGAMVTVDKADFIDAAGNPVTGDVELTITPVDVSNPAAVAAFPGSFAGIPEGETDATLIVSLGVVEYEFTSNGQPINLAPNTSAEIIVPIYVSTYPDGSAIKLGDSIPLWSLNEITSIWQQEGEGTVVASSYSPTGFAFQATVTHFSWWNCDVAPQTAQVEITVLGEAAGDAIISAEAPGLINWRGETASTTLNVGDTSDLLDIPTGMEVCFYADITYDAGGLALTGEVCVTATPGQMFQIILSAATEGPLDIGTSPKGEEEDTVIIHAVIDRPIPPVRLFPFTVEISVSYAVTAGQLPAGLSLNTFNNQARIVGEPTEMGSHSFTVTATDSDGFTDEIQITLEISDRFHQLLLPFDQARCNFTNTNPIAYLELKLASGEATIDWGDGSPAETIQVNNELNALSHNYTDQKSGELLITLSAGLEALTHLQAGRDEAGAHSCFSFDLSSLSEAQALKTLYVYPPMKITGDAMNLPRSLHNLLLGRGNAVSGNVKDLPQALIELDLMQTGASLTGNIADLPRSLTNLSLSGFNNFVTGEIKDLPVSLIELGFWGRYQGLYGNVKDLPQSLTKLTLGSASSEYPATGTITGNVKDLPRTLTNLNFFNTNNEVTGDVGNLPPQLTRLVHRGKNTVSGDVTGLPRPLTHIEFQGENSVSGDVAGLPSSLSFLSLSGANKVTGNIAGLPASLITIRLAGNNTVFGDLGQLAINDATTIAFSGESKISEFGLNPTWNPAPKPARPQGGFSLYLGGSIDLDANEVDRLLLFLNNKLPTRYWLPAPAIRILGSSSPRTNASDTAVSELIDKRYQVFTN